MYVCMYICNIYMSHRWQAALCEGLASVCEHSPANSASAQKKGAVISPLSRNPKPETRNTKHKTRNPKTETLHSKRIPKTRTWNPQPATRDPKPETRHSRSETRKPKTETRNPKTETGDRNHKSARPPAQAWQQT